MRILATIGPSCLSRVCLTLVFISTSAPSEEPIVRACEAAPTAEDEARAHRLFEQGKKSFREGRFQDAVHLLKEVYRLKCAPEPLYNLGRAYDNLGELGAAIGAFEAYLRASPNAEDRGAVEERIGTLKRQLAEREKLKREREEAEKRQNDQARRERRPSAAPWIVAGTGGAVVLAGGVFGLFSLNLHNQANSPVETGQQEAIDKNDRAKTFANVANVGYVAGGVIAAVGIVWGIVDLQRSGNTAAQPVRGATPGPLLGMGGSGIEIVLP